LSNLLYSFKNISDFSQFFYDNFFMKVQEKTVQMEKKVDKIKSKKNNLSNKKKKKKKTQTTYHCKLSKQKQLLPKQPSLEPSLFCLSIFCFFYLRIQLMHIFIVENEVICRVRVTIDLMYLCQIRKRNILNVLLY